MRNKGLKSGSNWLHTQLLLCLHSFWHVLCLAVTCDGGFKNLWNVVAVS